MNTNWQFFAVLYLALITSFYGFLAPTYTILGETKLGDPPVAVLEQSQIFHQPQPEKATFYYTYTEKSLDNKPFSWIGTIELPETIQNQINLIQTTGFIWSASQLIIWLTLLSININHIRKHKSSFFFASLCLGILVIVILTWRNPALHTPSFPYVDTNPSSGVIVITQLKLAWKTVCTASITLVCLIYLIKQSLSNLNLNTPGQNT